MGESIKTRLMRFKLNLFPAYRGTGGRVTYISSDMKRVRIEIPLKWKTRNYVGTIFGGSIYGAVDPIYMVMFIHLLGPKYIVWDRAATIQFKKPGRSTLTAEFVVDEEELSSIREELERTEKTNRTYRVDLFDQSKTVCASIEKNLHFQKKKN
jgi:acyl-coenzyme A thioesterase PaaI-like protein